MKCVLPLQNAVDYESLLAAVRAEGETNILFVLREQLPVAWCNSYVATVRHPTNIVRLKFRTFEYICDLYSELEATGEVPYDQTIQNRVVAVLGTSARAEEGRDAGRIREWDRPTDELLGTEETGGISWRTASVVDSM